MTKIILLSVALMGSVFATEKIAISAPAKITVGEKEHIFKVEDDSLVFKDSIVRELAFGKKVTIAYKNNTKKSISLKFTLRLYTKYGFLLGEQKVGGGLFGGTHLETGELAGDKFYIEWIDHKEIFRHSNFITPEDFKQVAWASFYKPNFTLQQ